MEPKEPKKFHVFILDDESTSGDSKGWLRPFIQFLKPYGYLREGAILPNNSSKHPLAWTVVANQVGARHTAFGAGLEWFSQHFRTFDFYFFDLRMGGGFIRDMDDTRYERFAEVILASGSSEYHKDRSNPQSETEFVESFVVRKDFMEKMPADFAGIEYVLATASDEKPKFIYSAAEETEFFRSIIKLFSSRLRDIHIMNLQTATSNPHEGIKNYGEIDEILTRYLRSRQMEVVNRQAADFRRELLGRLDRNEDYDEADIPDDGVSREGECWSLRTLFPKQVNALTREHPGGGAGAARTDSDAYRYVREVLHYGFRELRRWISHADTKMQSEGEVHRVQSFKNRVASLKMLDFRIGNKKAAGYRPVSYFEDCTDEKTSEKGGGPVQTLSDIAAARIRGLRDCIIEEGRSKFLEIAARQPSPEKVPCAPLFECGKPYVPGGTDEMKAWVEVHGIYPLDVAYIYQIADVNKTRCEAENCHFRLAPGGDHLELYFMFDAPQSWLGDPSITAAAMKGAQVAAGKARNTDLKLDDEGIGDVVRIVCKRYQGTFEFVVGPHTLVVERSGSTVRETPADERGCVFYRIRIDNMQGR